MTGFWVYMLFMCLLTPAMMIGFGKYFMKGGPKQINGVFGYRTPRSMKNQETWSGGLHISIAAKYGTAVV